MVDVAEAFGVEGLSGEELTLGGEGGVFFVNVAGWGGRGGGEEAIADYPGNGCALKGC